MIVHGQQVNKKKEMTTVNDYINISGSYSVSLEAVNYKSVYIDVLFTVLKSTSQRKLTTIIGSFSVVDVHRRR